MSSRARRRATAPGRTPSKQGPVAGKETARGWVGAGRRVAVACGDRVWGRQRAGGAKFCPRPSRIEGKVFGRFSYVFERFLRFRISGGLREPPVTSGDLQGSGSRAGAKLSTSSSRH